MRQRTPELEALVKLRGFQAGDRVEWKNYLSMRVTRGILQERVGDDDDGALWWRTIIDPDTGHGCLVEEDRLLLLEPA